LSPIGDRALLQFPLQLQAGDRPQFALAGPQSPHVAER
jgi:hypothetical protein